MFASGYVPGQVASLLADSKTKTENPELVTLFKSPQPKKKKKQALNSTATEDDLNEGSPVKRKKSVLSEPSTPQTSEDAQIKKKKGKKKKKKLPCNGDGTNTSSEENQAQDTVSVKEHTPVKNKKQKKKDTQSPSENGHQQELENSPGSADSPPEDEKLEAIEKSDAEDKEISRNDPASKKPKKKPPTDPDATVFVGNLPNSSDKKILKKIFKKFGKIVSVRFRSATPADPKVPKKVAAIKKEFHDSRNNINAYVVFESKEQAQSATKANGITIDGFTIRVDLLQGATKHDHIRSVFVGNLPFDVEEEPLRQHFLDCGKIENVRVIRDSKSGLGKGFGYILFKDKDGASFATHLNGEVFQGRRLRIERSVEQEKPKERPNKSKEIPEKKKKKERHRLRMPTNALSKDYQGIHAQNVQKMKKKQKFKKKQKRFAKTDKVPQSKDGKTFKQPPKGKHRGENARFRMSLKQKKNKS